MHALDEFEDRDGWWIAVCNCGSESPPCPDREDAANFWGQHLLAARED